MYIKHAYFLQLITTKILTTNITSQPLRLKQVEKGVHFIFEIDSRLKFSGEYDAAGCILKKGAQSAFFRGVLPFWGSKFGFQYLMSNYGYFFVCVCMFSGMKD